MEGLPPKDPKEAKEKAPKSKAAPKAKGKAKAKAKPKANRVPGGRQWTPPGGFGRKNYQVKDGNTMNENTLVTLVNLISQSIGATLIHLQEVGHSSLRSKLYFLIDIRKDPVYHLWMCLNFQMPPGCQSIPQEDRVRFHFFCGEFGTASKWGVSCCWTGSCTMIEGFLKSIEIFQLL